MSVPPEESQPGADGDELIPSSEVPSGQPTAPGAQVPSPASAPGAAQAPTSAPATPAAATPSASSTPPAAAGGAPAPGASTGAAPAPPVKPKLAVNLIAQVQLFFFNSKKALQEFSLVFKGLFSTDPPTRKMSYMFLVSMLGLITVLGVVWKRNWDKNQDLRIQHAKEIARMAREAAKKEAEEARLRKTIVSMGTFDIELKDIPDQKRVSGVVNMALMEVVAFCDSQETMEYLEDHRIMARNELTNTLTALDRDDILTVDGKRRLKGILIRQLNQWLPEGEILDLYFPKLIVN